MNQVATLLADKTLKNKVKTKKLSQWLLEHRIAVADLVNVAAASKDAAKATCIEALEFATQQQPAVADLACF